MWTVFIPIACIAIVFASFYMFKGKFSSKTIRTYDDAYRAWSEDKESVLKEMFSNPDKLKMIQDAVGEVQIEAMCPCEPKKSFARKLFKGTTEVLTSRQTFDMSLYYMAIAGGELHLLQSDGRKIMLHDSWELKEMKKVDIRPEGNASKVANMLTSNNSSAQSTDSIFFTVEEDDYSYKLLTLFYDFPAFTIQKTYDSGKYGHNPFYRVNKVDLTAVTMFRSVYGPEAIAKFREMISALK